jgi:hypothetical protein
MITADGTTETDVVVPVRRLVPVPIGAAQVLRLIVPGPAAQNPVRATSAYPLFCGGRLCCLIQPPRSLPISSSSRHAYSYEFTGRTRIV